MIQMITYAGNENKYSGKDLVVNSMHSPQSLDEFDINIISLADNRIWINDSTSTTTINMIKDIKSLAIMVHNCMKTKIIVVMPQNERFTYNKYNASYYSACELKDMLDSMMGKIVAELHTPLGTMKLMYENTKTNVNGLQLPAAFYFNTGKGILFSEKSQKMTAIHCGNIYATTLEIKSYDAVLALLNALKLITTKQDIPQWIEEIKMFDDEEQMEIIEEQKRIVDIATQTIEASNVKLVNNLHFKSVLYSSGDELVDVTFEILEQMLGCDLSGFVDVKKEDFQFELGEYVFIGEIKGVNHNVKNENISQLDVHYQSYLDEHQEVDEKNIFALLIMNHQKNKDLKEREPIHENQIKLARRNGSLIIETITLLQMFERYLAEKMTRQQCVDILTKQKGLLGLVEEK